MENRLIIILHFLMIFSCFLPTPGTCSNTNETDLLALLALRASINLDPTGSLDSWNETTHFCSWKGIQCGHKHRDRVVAIRLRSQGLAGTLSPHIGNLSFLRRIILQNNSFNGHIPKEIGLLRRLEVVEFSNNSFLGSIPGNLSQCKNLFHLNLIDNHLSGTIPPVLGFMHKLEALGLGKNNFAGHIPPFIGNLTSLKRLSLVSCNMNGEIPASLAQLQSLIFFQLGGNAFTGKIPIGLFNISTLVTFGADTNKLEGAIPPSIGLTLPNLRRINMGVNKFSGGVPTSLSNISSMEELELYNNRFTGKMPRGGSFPNLRWFTISGNHIQDDLSFISSFTNCTRLQAFDVGENLLSGSLPDSIANLSAHLNHLSISNNEIRGNIPSGIANLIGLTQFFLFRNNLDGPVPRGIGKLSNLIDLVMDDNKFTNELPSTFGNLTSLSALYLHRNNFSGSVPNSLSNCTKLLQLALSRNNFSGPIPRGIMNISSLSIFLDLSHNALTSSIPFEVGSLKNLGILDLSNNRLSGVIPGSLSMCMSLQHLHLEGNSLQGEIPLQLSALRGLQDLDLSRNNLSGPVPSFLGEFQLENLNLSFNRLSGVVPTRGVFTNMTAISLVGNTELCGGILELNLHPCTLSNSSNKKLSTLLKILIPSIVSLVLCLVIIFFFYKRRTSRRNSSSSVPSFIDNQVLRLSYADLSKTTGGFSGTNLLGVGGFGSVYKGILDDGTLVAVKVLNLVVKGASKSFLAECVAQRNIRHRNLSVIQRLNVAIDIAQAVEYLHSGTDSTIVHGDLKPSNILLDGAMSAHVGDFGLAKIVSSILLRTHESNNSSIAIKGTIGYVAPEYGTNDSFSTHGDVYSYGILLLEIFTSKRPTDDSFKDDVTLHSFVSNALSEDRILEIVDPLIQIGHATKNQQFTNCMASVLSIGVACSKKMPRERMTMTDVVAELHKIKDRYLA